MEEILRQLQIQKEQNRHLKNQLNNIKDRIIEMNDIFDDVNLKMKETLLIDGDIIYREKFDKIKKNNQEIVNDLTNVIIPSVSSRT